MSPIEPRRILPQQAVPCPRCRKLVSRASTACIHCGLPRPNLFYQIPVLGEFLAEPRLNLTDKILLICFSLYAVAIALNLPATAQSGEGFSLLTPDFYSLLKLGMGGIFPALQEGRWYTLITATFLHGDLLHLLFNMLWLRDVGAQTESFFDSSRFWVIYAGAGITGSLFSLAAGEFYVLGASGAIFGLFGALIYYGWHRGGWFGSMVARRLMIWTAIGFAYGLVSTNISNAAHLGGFLGGAAIAALLGYNELRSTRLWHHILAAILMLIYITAFVFMFINFFNFN